MAKRASQLGKEFAGPGIVLVEPDEPINEWIAAVNFVDVCGDKEPLLKQLRKTGETRDLLLADLLERHQLRRQRKRGGQSVPIYDLSRADWSLTMALNDMRNHGASLEAAADRYKIDKRALKIASDGKRGSLRRAKERLDKLRQK